jgi:AcrR family transcriptional regulator
MIGGMATERTPTRRVATAVRRQEILATAAAMFDEAGYALTSMDAIAAAVGIAKPTVYHHFGSKHEILSAIHEEFIDQLIARQEARDGVGLRPDQHLLEIMSDILELMETHRGYLRVFFEHHRELPDEVRAAVRDKRDRYQELVVEVIRAGIADGSFRATDPTLAALALFGMCNWAYQWYRPGGRLRPREVAYEFWGYLVRGLSP